MDIGEVFIPVPTKTARDASILVLFASQGDTIRRNQLIALLEGDKGVLQVFSPFLGVVKEIQVKAGEKVAPGSPILTLDRIESSNRRSGQSGCDARHLPALPVRHAVHKPSATAAPTLAAFQRQIEDVLGAPLTAPATLAVADVWGHWNAFSNGLARQELEVQLALEYAPADRGQQLARYAERLQTLSRPLLLVGVALVFFLWQAGIALIALGLGTHFGAVYLRADGNHLRDRKVAPPSGRGCCEPAMVRLCAQYILGMAVLSSPTGRSQWPDYPSSVLTGRRTRIPGTQPRENQ